jgi:hypothetical protein
MFVFCQYYNYLLKNGQLYWNMWQRHGWINYCRQEIEAGCGGGAVSRDSSSDWRCSLGWCLITSLTKRREIRRI